MLNKNVNVKISFLFASRPDEVRVLRRKLNAAEKEKLEIVISNNEEVRDGNEFNL